MSVQVVAPELFITATTHQDLEKQRIATENRLRILTTTEPDDDGVVRGFGLPESAPEVTRVVEIVVNLKGLEHKAELDLKKSMKKSNIYPWVKDQIGLGEKQFARLLAAIGDPYWNLNTDQPRTVSQLWAYSGLHVFNEPTEPSSSDTDHNLLTDTPTDHVGVAARRKKGQQANWSVEAKTRAYLCATSCLKQAKSPYREVYLARREHTAKTHPEWTAGHSHNDALRIMSKEILKRAWRESKRIHEEAK